LRIGIAYGSPYYLRFYESALSTLLRRGHRLVLVGLRNEAEKVPPYLRSHRRVSLVSRPSPADRELAVAARLLRLTRDASRFLTPELAEASASRARARRRLARALWGDAQADVPPTLDALLDANEAPRLARALATIERALPADAALCHLIREERLDLVAEISRVSLGGEQAELAKAAQASGIPSALLVYSWDNLSSKGLLHVAPDRLLVWNDIQVGEAVRLHGIHREAVVPTGAPRFDGFFARRPSLPRAELLRELGLDPSRPTILYLGSSSFVAPREREFVERWLAALRAAPAPLSDSNVLVRPHPGTAAQDAWDEIATAGVAVVTAERRNREQDLLDQLTACDAAVALNTSAEIEAAIVDRPVLTVRAGAELAPGQEGALHFRYLLRGSGGFVEEAGDLAAHVAQLRQALTDDPGAEARRSFVASFVRPRGVDRPVGPIVAEELERLATRRRRLRYR
jgi:hypothetical protein